MACAGVTAGGRRRPGRRPSRCRSVWRSRRPRSTRCWAGRRARRSTSSSAWSLAVATRPSEPLVLERELPPGLGARWTPSLPAGAYVLAVTARWADGDVVYYFPIGLSGEGAVDLTGAPPEPVDLGPAGVGSLPSNRPTPAAAVAVTASAPTVGPAAADAAGGPRSPAAPGVAAALAPSSDAVAPIPGSPATLAAGGGLPATATTMRLPVPVAPPEAPVAAVSPPPLGRAAGAGSPPARRLWRSDERLAA